jgi:LacI family transcriptional regulator
MAPRPRQVALALGIGVSYVERILRGITTYARAHGPWHFAFNPETAMVPIGSLARFGGDGVIGMIGTRADERRAARLGIPVVNVSAALDGPRLPTVAPDDRAVGRIAARHLLDRGFRRFGYFGLQDVAYGRVRGQGFVETVEAARLSCAVHLVRSRGGRPWHVDRADLGRWLRSLRPPVGILAVHDYRARLLLEVAASLGLRVPEDAAVVGVNDDVVACEFSAPSLSSVVLPGEAIGFEAAALLDRLMRGRAAPERPTLVAPEGLVARRSTDILAVDDPATAAAVRFIVERLERPLGVDEVAAHVDLSRRALELRFRAHLGLSPHELISRRRVERAQRLLLEEPRARLKEIARRCGFTDARRLHLVFRRVAGLGPRAWRERERKAPHAGAGHARV